MNRYPSLTIRSEGSPMPESYALMRVGFPYLKTIGARRQIPYPIDVAFGSDGKVYVVCANDGLRPFTVLSVDNDSSYDFGPQSWREEANNSKIIPNTFSSPSQPKDTLLWPVSVVVDSEENRYLSDEGLDRIWVCNKDGEHLFAWGKHGSKDGELNRPSGIAVDSDNNIFVVDTMNHRVQKFTNDGIYISTFGRFGSGNCEFNMPWGIAIDKTGYIYVSDWRNDRIQKIGLDGKFILEFGRSGTAEGEFNRPAGIAVDSDGDIYVADWRNRRIQLFDRNGKYVQKFLGEATLSEANIKYLMLNKVPLRALEYGSVDQRKLFDPPRTVRVDSKGRMFVVDTLSRRIQVYQKQVIQLDPDDIAEPFGAPTLML